MTTLAELVAKLVTYTLEVDGHVMRLVEEDGTVAAEAISFGLPGQEAAAIQQMLAQVMQTMPIVRSTNGAAT